MLHHQRRLPLPRPTAALTATQLRVVLTLHLLLLQISAGKSLDATASESMRLATQGSVLALAQGGIRDYESFRWSAMGPCSPFASRSVTASTLKRHC